MATSVLAKIREFFEMEMAEFKREWTALTPEDKAQLKQGMEDGTLTY